MTLCDREASLEEQGAESNRFNAVFGARSALAVFSGVRSRNSVCRPLQPTGPFALLWRVRLSIVITRE